MIDSYYLVITNKWYQSVSQSVPLCPWANKTMTRDRHCCLSFAFFLSSPQLTLIAHIFFSTVSHQASLGLPLTHFPGGVHCKATRGMADGSILGTWLIQHHLLFFTSQLMCNSSFEMMFGQKMFRFWHKWLRWYVSNLWRMVLVIFRPWLSPIQQCGENVTLEGGEFGF